MVLGLLTSHLHHERTYYTEIAKRARLYHNIVAQFTPSCIDAKTDLVTGLLYDTDTGNWAQQTFPIPSYIYDRCQFPEGTEFQQAKSIIHSLHKRSSTIFLNGPLIDSNEIREHLLTNKRLAPYMAHIKKGSVKTILKLLQEEKDVIIKPVDIHSNRTTYRITYKDKAFHIEALHDQTRSPLMFKHKNEFLSWCNPFVQSDHYIIHLMLYPPDQLKYPVHIRCLLQKNKEKTWKVIEQCIQTSKLPLQFLLPAIKNATLHPFTKIHYLLSPIGVQLLQEALHDITTEVPKTLDPFYPSLFELELSIVMDKTGAIWLMHVDTKPSYTPFMEHNQTLAEEIFHGPLRFSRFTP
ncbi:YheC/YheD family protein [Bacillus sp. NPDC094106]|uniref:YheC/YheD family protein n=1 Tax=Bacillus sp. NPDC094106 TaxID=3363949 RepID=UPI003814DDD2